MENIKKIKPSLVDPLHSLCVRRSPQLRAKVNLRFCPDMQVAQGQALPTVQKYPFQTDILTCYHNNPCLIDLP
jgi:hypothetical protein